VRRLDGDPRALVADRIADADRGGHRLRLHAMARAERRRRSCDRTGSRPWPARPAAAARRLIQPPSCASRRALPNALVLPRFPAGTAIQSGASQARSCSISHTIVFCPRCGTGSPSSGGRCRAARRTP
jgi:hypothetical protein